MRVLISAGGTGGHIFPALAIYHQLEVFRWKELIERIFLTI